MNSKSEGAIRAFKIVQLKAFVTDLPKRFVGPLAVTKTTL